MILKGSVPEINPLVVSSEEDIPANLTSDTAEQLRLALKGYESSPKKLLAYFLEEDAEDYQEALDYFEVTNVTYLCAPTCETDGQTQALVTWVKAQRANKKKVKAVLPNAEADHEGIINYTTESVQIGDKEYGPEAFCARIAGLLAGTPADISCTFAQIPEAEDCTRRTREKLSEEIDAGHFVVFHDGEKVKVGRGVNSLQTVGRDKSEAFKKIKIVETMDMIHDDMVKLVEEYYIGKYPNTYDNKCVVVCAILDYFKELQNQGILESYSAEVDAGANLAYLKSKGLTEYNGVKLDELSDKEIRKADTDEKVFLAARIHILDAMEDLTLNITV